MRPVLPLALFAAVIAAAACGSEPSVPCEASPAGATSAPTCGEPPAASLAPVRTFRTHVVRTSSAVGGATRLAEGVAGGVADCFAQIIAPVVAEALLGDIDAGPGECSRSYAANGAYSFTNGTYTYHGRQRGGDADVGASAELRLFVLRDAGPFKAGDLVTVDAVRLESYLVGARGVLSSTGKPAIAYDEVGPLVELLGKGATPPNPLPLTEDMRTSLTSAFEMEGSVHTDLSDCGATYRTIVDLTIPRAPITADVHPNLVSAVMTSTADPNVRISATVWDATYSPSTPGVPAGHVDAAVAGISPMTHARVEFDDPIGESASLTIACAP